MFERLGEIDGQLLVAFQHAVTTDWLTPIVKFITHLGNGGLIWIAIIALLLIFRKTRKAGLVALIALIIEVIINNLILKNLVARTRPYDAVPAVHLLIEKQPDYSFPSGHASSSFTVAVTMMLMLKGKLKRYAAVPALVLAFLIALSRLYVGVHYPGDVLVGGADGTLIAWLVYKADQSIEAKRNLQGGKHFGGR